MIKIKNIKKQENKFIILSVLTVVVFLFVVLSGIYFRNLIERKGEIIQEDSRKAILQLESEKELKDLEGEEVLEDEPALFEAPNQLKDSKIGRYFLTEIKLTDNYYYAVINKCLREDENSDYPDYIWGTWSQLDYPDFNPEIALVRYRLLPEDNDSFQPNETCYIKEIKTDKDWQEVKERYGFSKNRFI